MFSEREHELMAMAIEAARKGETSPNPRVGAVIADSDGNVISVGFHERAGLAHAEVDAIAKAHGQTMGMTLFVTLEPCNHHGRTPPCTEAILRAGFSRVVVGCPDPKPHVPGGSDRMRAAGVQVEFGLLGEDCSRLVADFAKHVQTGLPYVTLKAALTLDGKMATSAHDSKWITSPESRAVAHGLRSESDAILVGVGTVLDDDPQLNVRHVQGRSPRVVVLDSKLRTPPSAKLFATGADVLVYTQPGQAGTSELAGATVVEVPAIDGHLVLEEVLRDLGRRDVMRVLVEGGAAVHASFLRGNWADEVALFIAPKLLGQGMSFAEDFAKPSMMSEALDLRDVTYTTIGRDILVRGLLR